MGTYLVNWNIELDAKTPREAAEKALGIQRDPESIATFFEVWDGNKTVKIDLEDEDN